MLHLTRIGLLLFVMFASAAEPAAAAPAIGWDYDVSIAPDGQQLTVQLCFRGMTPGPLRLMRPDALAAAKMLAHPDGSASYRPGGPRGAIVPRLGSQPCLRYSISLAAVRRAASGGEIQIRDQEIIVNPGLFLLFPSSWPANATVTARFDAPADLRVATPWRSIPGTQRLVLNPGVMRSGSRMAIGRFRHLTVDAAHARFEVAVFSGERLSTDAGIQAWITRVATTVSDLFGGRFPVNRVLVLVVPGRASRDPVVFGRTQMTGGGNNVTLYLSGNARDADLPDEWVAVHEFTHLGLPWTPKDDSWFSEGFVTYYQEVLRGRSGHLTEREAWQRLNDGFHRGRRSGTSRRLEDESRAMHQTHAYHRVYWGGAAIALAADLAIRRQSRGTKSLDDVIRFWWQQYPHGRSYKARDLLAAADRMLGFNACSGLARRFLDQTEFPSLRAEYAALGLTERDGAVVYADRGAQMVERTRIMRAGGR